MSDQLSSGRRIRLFNVIDDYTRACHAIIVDVSINGQRVARELTRLIDWHGLPEFTSLVIVRRHINWNNQRPDLKEDLAHLVDNIKRRICGIASAGFPSFSV